ncbi:MAG TPA: hypothetical protein O0X39_04040 [Methanocorpusculum sp.]|nr:hypothetical protein [Methanocorpusculum sp.]
MIIDLARLADSLYEESEDDDLKLAELLHSQPAEVAHALCTSNLLNALQAYLYAFDEEPDIDVYDKLLLCSAAEIPAGIKIAVIELAEIVFLYDKARKTFVIGVYDGEKFLTAYEGRGSYKAAVRFAKENCAE